MTSVLHHEMLLKLAAKLIHPVAIIVLKEGEHTKGQPVKEAAVAHLKSLSVAPQPTDIVIFKDKAYHYHDGVLDDADGYAVAAASRRASDPTVVHLSADLQDFVVWHSDHPFAIADVRPISAYPDRARRYSGPNNPFYRELPFGDDQSDASRVVVSGPIRPTAVGGLFKVTLRINGKEIDPHIAT